MLFWPIFFELSLDTTVKLKMSTWLRFVGWKTPRKPFYFLNKMARYYIEVGAKAFTAQPVKRNSTTQQSRWQVTQIQSTLMCREKQPWEFKTGCSRKKYLHPDMQSLMNYTIILVDFTWHHPMIFFSDKKIAAGPWQLVTNWLHKTK